MRLPNPHPRHMNRPFKHSFSTLVAHMEAGAPDGTTRFSRLSEEAQEIIVSSAVGEYDQSGPPPMSDAVRAELLAWASEKDDPQEP